MMDFMKPTPLDLEAEDRLRAAIDAGEIGPDAELWRFFARHTATTRAELAAKDAEIARLREALGKHNFSAANGDEVTVADEMDQAAGTLEAFVVADKEHNLLDCADNDDTPYQSAWMAGLMDHATLNARTLRTWATTLRAALSERPQ